MISALFSHHVVCPTSQCIAHRVHVVRLDIFERMRPADVSLRHEAAECLRVRLARTRTTYCGPYDDKSFIVPCPPSQVPRRQAALLPPCGERLRIDHRLWIGTALGWRLCNSSMRWPPRLCHQQSQSANDTGLSRIRAYSREVSYMATCMCSLVKGSPSERQAWKASHSIALNETKKGPLLRADVSPCLANETRADSLNVLPCWITYVNCNTAGYCPPASNCQFRICVRMTRSLSKAQATRFKCTFALMWICVAPLHR